MARLLVHVEGQTEEDFVNEVLRNHLLNQGFESVGARIVGNNRLRRRRGGIRAWPSVRRDILRHLWEDPGCIATTMVDFYGLPKQGEGAWPGRAGCVGQSTSSKASSVEKAIMKDIVDSMGSNFDPKRFVPFVVMHEFEGMLFSDCGAFSLGIGQPALEPKFRRVRDGFDTPEDINDSPISAPSKRIEDIVPGYEKPLLGTLAVLEIGLVKIRSECPHFASWLAKLESLANY
jgi:hypothetical protein